MSTFNSIEEAREFFKGDKFATNLGVSLEKLDEDSQCRQVDFFILSLYF